MQSTSVRRAVVEPGGSGVVAHVGLHAIGTFADRLGLGDFESHWDSWRLQTLETRMEPWERTTNEEARRRGATHLRRK